MSSRNDLVPKRIVNANGVETTVYVRRDQSNHLDGNPLKSIGAPSSVTSSASGPSHTPEYTTEQRRNVSRAIQTYNSVAEVVNESMDRNHVANIALDNEYAHEAVEIIRSNMDDLDPKTQEILKGSVGYRDLFGGAPATKPAPRVVRAPVAIGSKVIHTDPEVSQRTGFVTGQALTQGRAGYDVTWSDDPFDPDAERDVYMEGDLRSVALGDEDLEKVRDALGHRGISASVDDVGMTLDLQDGIHGVIGDGDFSTIRFCDDDGQEVWGRSWSESSIGDGEEPSNIAHYIDAIDKVYRAVERDLHNNPYQG